MLKAADNSTKTNAYAIKAKSIMEIRKRKFAEIEKLADTINSLEKKRKEL